MIVMVHTTCAEDVHDSYMKRRNQKKTEEKLLSPVKYLEDK